MRVLESIPPKDPDDRRQWFAKKLEHKSARLFHQMDATRAEADALFAEIDQRRIREEWQEVTAMKKWRIVILRVWHGATVEIPVDLFVRTLLKSLLNCKDPFEIPVEL